MSPSQLSHLFFLLCSSVAQLCLTLCNPMECSMTSFLFFTTSQSCLKLMSVESVMSSNHLALCCPLLLLPSIFPSIRVFTSGGQNIPFYCFPLFLCIFHLRMLSSLSLLFSGTLHSVRFIFPFLLFLALLFFSQLFVRPSQTTTLPSCISFSGDCFGHHSLYSVTNFHP